LFTVYFPSRDQSWFETDRYFPKLAAVEMMATGHTGEARLQSKYQFSRTTSDDALVNSSEVQPQLRCSSSWRSSITTEVQSGLQQSDEPTAVNHEECSAGPLQ
jgi:hypothetical protein